MSKHKQWGKTFVNNDQPLYSSDDYIGYFEMRMKTLIREEIEIFYRNLFYSAPFWHTHGIWDMILHKYAENPFQTKGFPAIYQ